MGGIVAAGHPATAQAGADVLRGGGNAVDAAVAAMAASFVAEPLLTGLGAGGYALVCAPGVAPVLLDFFVEAPGRAGSEGRCELVGVAVSFGDAGQEFHVGPASVGTYGCPAGLAALAARWGTLALCDLVAPAVLLAREGIELNAAQAYIASVLEPIIATSPATCAIFRPDGRVVREGEALVQPELADTLERLGQEGPDFFYTGDFAEAACAYLGERGGVLTRADLAAYAAIDRAPVDVTYRGRHVLTNPPPNAGGILLAHALSALEAAPSPPALADVVAAMRAAQDARGPDFYAGLAEPGFARRFLGNTTHLSVLDDDGLACSVTCTNGEGSGVVVPGTGVHLNNIMGEEDLSPAGFFTAPPGCRMPSMMAPTVVVGRDGRPELVLGSAGSTRIRSAILQTVVGTVDHGLDAQAAVEAPRVHYEGGTVYAEPGVADDALAGLRLPVVRFAARNLYFGGVQAVERDPATGELSGGADPRRGGVAVRSR